MAFPFGTKLLNSTVNVSSSSTNPSPITCTEIVLESSPGKNSSVVVSIEL